MVRRRISIARGSREFCSRHGVQTSISHLSARCALTHQRRLHKHTTCACMRFFAIVAQCSKAAPYRSCRSKSGKVAPLLLPRNVQTQKGEQAFHPRIDTWKIDASAPRRLQMRKCFFNCHGFLSCTYSYSCGLRGFPCFDRRFNFSKCKLPFEEERSYYQPPYAAARSVTKESANSSSWNFQSLMLKGSREGSRELF